MSARVTIALLALIACRSRDAPSPTPAPPSSTSSATSTATPIPASSANPDPAPSRDTDPSPHPAFRKLSLSPDDLARLVASSPPLSRFASDTRSFDPADGSYLLRSQADREGVSFTTQPIVWSPDSNDEILVVTARGQAASFVAAFRAPPGAPWKIASSLVLLGEVSPVALAYRPGQRGTLWWTSCWQCSGEMGHVSLRDDGHVVVVQE